MVAKTTKKPTAPLPKGEAMAQKQEAILQNLSAEDKRHIQRVRDWIDKAERAVLKERYQLGSEIKALYDAKSKNGKERYGLKFIAKLCAVFGWDHGLIYGALAVAEAFTAKQINGLCYRPMANGRLIPYGHLRALAGVTNKKTRERLLNQAIASSWTREELEVAIIQAGAGEKKEDPRGRPLKPPKDLAALLRQQERSAEEFVRRATKVWAKKKNSFMGKVEKLPKKEVTEDQVNKLREHAAILRQLVTKADEQAAEADRAADFLMKKLKTNGSEAATASAKAASPSRNGKHPRSGKA